MTAGSRTSPYPLIGAIWLTAVLIAGALGLFARLPFPGPQIVLAGLTSALVAAAALDARFREWLVTLDLRAAIAIHLSRFVGIYFLVLYRAGLLPFEFGVLGGWGDITIAVTATLWLVLTRDPMRHRGLLVLWNIAGLVDIVFVALTAGRLGMASPGALAPLRVLPLCLLPGFFVPLILASHFLIFWRVRRTMDAER